MGIQVLLLIKCAKILTIIVNLLHLIYTYYHSGFLHWYFCPTKFKLTWKINWKKNHTSKINQTASSQAHVFRVTLVAKDCSLQNLIGSKQKQYLAGWRSSRWIIDIVLDGRCRYEPHVCRDRVSPVLLILILQADSEIIDHTLFSRTEDIKYALVWAMSNTCGMWFTKNGLC
jgi:hypothetical protein